MTTRAAGSRRGWILPWWLVMVEGVIVALFGLLLLTAPGATVLFMIQVLGLYLFVAGVLRIVDIFNDSSAWGLKLSLGILCLLASLLVLRHPLWSAALVPTVVVYYVGFLSLVQGGLGLFVGIREGDWGVGVLGALGVLFGVLLVINPLIGVASLPFVLGFFMLVGGIAAVVQALRMR